MNWATCPNCCSPSMTGNGSMPWMALSERRYSMPNLKITATVSIVVPFHNEELNVIELYGRLQGVMEELGCDYQFVFVDDGSTDHTYKLLKELAEIDSKGIAVRWG